MTDETVAKCPRKDGAVRYLANNAEFLGYPTALVRGLPITTRVIEGMSRFVVKARMAISGAQV